MTYFGWFPMEFSDEVVVDMAENPGYKRYLLSLIGDDQSVRDAMEAILSGDS